MASISVRHWIEMARAARLTDGGRAIPSNRNGDARQYPKAEKAIIGQQEKPAAVHAD